MRSIAAHLAGDVEAARRVELELPETGVCSGPGTRLADAEGCCGGPPLARTEACCAEDAAAKAAGGEGCGCGPSVRLERARVEAGCCGPA